MDSVILYFGKATHEQVELAAKPLGLVHDTFVRDQTRFYFYRYSDAEQLSENDAAEIARLRSLLGSYPTTAFVVPSRHGESARFALEVISNLMQRFPPAVLDDDCGNFWSSDEVRACFESGTSNGIYSLKAG